MAALQLPDIPASGFQPTLSSYVRGKLPKGEVSTFTDCARVLSSAKFGSPESIKEVAAKVLPRIAQFGNVPPAILPVLVALKKLPEDKKTERKLLRLVNYFVQLLAGEGTAGSVVPFHASQHGQLVEPAVGQFGPDQLEQAWADATVDFMPHYKRTAALRALAALARSAFVVQPDDTTYMGGLFQIVTTVIDKSSNKTLGRMPGKRRGKEERALLVQYGLQSAALAAARAGLPRPVLTTKMAVRAFNAITSADPLGARHALAITAMVAREKPQAYANRLGPALQRNLELFQKTGSLTGVPPPPPLPTDKAAKGAPAEKPAERVDDPDAINLHDTWSRVYLARGCGAMVQAAGGSEVGALFWEALIMLALSDPSDMVALEAIKGMVAAPQPCATSLRGQQEGPRSRHQQDYSDDSGSGMAAAWAMLVEQGDEELPIPLPPSTLLGAAPLAKQASLGSRLRRQAAEDASLKLLASAAQRLQEPLAGSAKLFAKLTQRLLSMMGSQSHATLCGALRAVAAIAEARSRALAQQPGAHLLGSTGVQRCMVVLRTMAVAVVSDPQLFAHERELALEALFWFNARGQDTVLAPAALVQFMGTGGGSLPPNVAQAFADPWPQHVVARFMGALQRRLASETGSAEYVLACASATVVACPSRVPHDALLGLWDAALRQGGEVGVGALQAALSLLDPPAAPITQPLSTAMPEVKAVASKEEVALAAVSRLAAWWLGENANYATGQFAWRPAEKEPMPRPHSAAEISSHEALAASAVAQSPLLALLISHLQRVMLAGPWEVRLAAAQALAKVAVRSPEPFRIQCYSILAAARTGRQPGSSGAASAAAGGSGQQGADPLGISSTCSAALELLDAMYSGELVVATLLKQCGDDPSAWPPKVAESIDKRHAALLAAVAERVCAVPRGEFLPLGPASRRVLEREVPDSESGDDAAQDDQSVASSGPAEPPPAGPGATSYLEALANFEYKAPEGEAAEAASVLSSRYEDGGTTDGEEEEDARSSDESEVMVRGATVMYDFDAENDDEVAVRKGDEITVEYEMGGWVYCTTAAGAKGLVPRGYVAVRDEEGGGAGDTVAAFLKRATVAEAAEQHSVQGSEDSRSTLGARMSYDGQAAGTAMPSSGMGHGHRRTLSSASAADQLAYAASMASDDFGGLTRTPTFRAPSAAEGGLTSMPSAAMSASSPTHAAARSALGDVLEEGEEGEEAVQQGRVLFGFAAEAEGELSVSPGDYVVVEAEIDGWLQVFRPEDEVRGLVPASYVELMG